MDSSLDLQSLLDEALNSNDIDIIQSIINRVEAWQGDGHFDDMDAKGYALKFLYHHLQKF